MGRWREPSGSLTGGPEGAVASGRWTEFLAREGARHFRNLGFF